MFPSIQTSVEFVRSDVDNGGVVWAQSDWSRPVEPGPFSVFASWPCIDLLSRPLVDSIDSSVLRFAIGRGPITRIDLHMEAVSSPEHVPVGVSHADVFSLSGATPASVVLQAAIDVIGFSVVK